MISKTNIYTRNNQGTPIHPNIIVGANGHYASGDVLDANSVEKLIEEKLAALVGGAGSNVDTLGEIASAIPTKLSDLTNDVGFITSSTVTTSQPFPANWPTTGNINETEDTEHNPVHGLIWAINHDNNAVPGKTYLSTVRYDDLPSDQLVLVEIKAEIMSEEPSVANLPNNTGTKVILFTVTSSAVSPYHWEATSVYGGDITWRAFSVN